ncbi:hypothetical protein CBOM_06432 [Ceraceosorus bombacis]|uniref:Uncharacterized protein n=1 Tax=Ceraceosorus bombacis TaxID=401625 RepID=A0A0P1BL48_9BASI|nr:hypothetical protein CBOM_06432 [Ceraceosorus bombacis]
MIVGKKTPIASVDRATLAAQQAESDASQMQPIKKRPKGNNGMRITPVKRARHAATSQQEASGLSTGSSNARHSKSMVSIKSSSPPDTSRRAGSSSCPANDRSWSDYQYLSHNAAHPPRRSTETRA